jgi:phosphoglycolate phosphatase-like HAD superfamily hydrolase
VNLMLGNVCGVILDVDGVLLDARPSYHAVAEEAARRAISPLVGEAKARSAHFDRQREVPFFKAAGRFNDDWEMARGIALLLYLRAMGAAPPLEEFLASAGGRGVEGLFARHPGMELPQEKIARICGALYGGDNCRELFGFDARDALPDAPARGMWQNELVLPDTALLETVAQKFLLALYTGRNPGEARLAQTLCKLKIPDSLCWVADGRPRKPDPAGLIWLCHLLLKGAQRGSQVLFIGDTADDLAASRAAQDRGSPIIYAHVEAPGDTSRVLSRLLTETGEGARA